MEKIGDYYVIDIKDEFYPKSLLELRKPPEKIFALGDINLLKKRMVAIVGSRKTSRYGQITSMKLSKELSAKGIVIVSGMALGIDSYAHYGCLKNGGKTIAVLGCGIDKCYPASNWRMKNEIRESGLVISEYGFGEKAQRWTFPQRNRIIAGLSELTIVVEAGANSGAMITAEFANELNKEVWVTPGNIDSPYSLGSNKLIQDGAMVIVNINDIFDKLKIYDKISNVDFKEMGLNKDEIKICKYLINESEATLESLAKTINLDYQKLLHTVTMLEIKGVVRTSVGRVFMA